MNTQKGREKRKKREVEMNNEKNQLILHKVRVPLLRDVNGTFSIAKEQDLAEYAENTTK